MRAALVIAGKDLRQRFRDRSAIVLGFIAPIVVAGLMSAAMSGSESFHFRMAVVDLDEGPLAAAFVDVLRSPALRDVVTVVVSETEQDAAAAVDDGTVATAIVIPAGFSAAAASTEPARLHVLRSVDDEIAGDVAASLADGFVAYLNGARLAVATALAAGASPATVDRLASDAARLEPSATVTDRPSGDQPLRGISYYGPGMAIFFVLFAIGFTARSWFTEVNQGTIDRIAAAPVRPAAILAGKALSVFVYGTTSLLTMVAVTSLAFDADWGPAPAAVAICVAIATSVVAATALVIVAARSDRQAEGIAAMLTFGLALVGGNFTFLAMAPEWMRRLSLFTPNGWALRAFTDLATGVPPVEAIATPLAGILAFTVAVGAAAAAMSRRAVIR